MMAHWWEAMLRSVWIVSSMCFDSELFKLHVMECLSIGSGQSFKYCVSRGYKVLNSCSPKSRDV